MVYDILHKLQTSKISVDVIPSWALFERNLDSLEVELASTLISFREQIMERIENDEHHVEDLASES